jgi:pSer/pThr/pTyr-binding forkhead associated (FHA) protein
MPVIYVLSGPDLGRTFDVEDGALFGRSPDCQVVLRDTGVSRRHARLELRGKTWLLVDQGSRNGISRDGQRLKELELEDGTLFEIGHLELRFRLQAQGVVGAPPPRTPPELEVERATQDLPHIRFDDDEQDEPEPSGRAGEIVLEDEEWLESPPPTPPATAAPRTMAAPRPVTAGTRPSPLPTRSAPPARDVPARGVEVRDAGRQILQYSKVPERRGFFQSDLGQYPLWVRLAAGLLVAAVFVAVFYFAYRSMGALKERAVGVEDVGGD